MSNAADGNGRESGEGKPIAIYYEQQHWFKPLFDRIVLHVLSRAVFGETLSVTRLPRDWREYLSPGLVAGQPVQRRPGRGVAAAPAAHRHLGRAGPAR